MTDAPARTCLGCRQSRPKHRLVRLVRRADGRVEVDARAPGRGAYVCAEPACVERALKAGRLGHAFRAPCRCDDGLAARVLAASAAPVGREVGEDAARVSRDVTARPGGPSVGGLGARSGPPASTRR